MAGSNMKSEKNRNTAQSESGVSGMHSRKNRNPAQPEAGGRGMDSRKHRNPEQYKSGKDTGISRKHRKYAAQPELLKAIDEGNVEKIARFLNTEPHLANEKLVVEGPNSNAWADMIYISPLERALEKGQAGSVKILLEKGAKIDLEKLATPSFVALIVAMVEAHPEISFLLEKKAREQAINDVKDNLTKEIEELKTYGKDLSQSTKKQGREKSLAAAQVITLLEKASHNFFSKENQSNKDIETFQTTIEKILKSDDAKKLSKYRVSWPTICKNILIALIPLVGLLSIGIKLAISKSKEGRPLFFFQKSKTRGEEKLDAISVVNKTGKSHK